MAETVQQVRKLRQQAAKALATLGKEIARQEQELTVLRAEAARWRGLAGGQAKGASATAVLRRAQRTKRRVDWSTVLARLPRTFTAQEVATKAGKPIVQVYTHLSQWMKARKVRRGKDGYQKVSGATPSRS